MARKPALRAALALLAAIIISVGIAPTGAQAAPPQRVVILPFTANAKNDISYLIKGIRDMLASRLTWQERVTVVEPDLVARAMAKMPGPYDDAKARRLGASLQAQVVIFGSVTVLGRSVSLDARLVRVAKDEPPLTAYVAAAEMDQVIPSINQFAQRINAEIFARPEAMAASKAPAQTSEAPKDAAEREEQAVGGSSSLDKLPANISPLNPLFRRALSGVESDRYWRSPRIPGTITSLAVADVDLDGKNELLVLLPNSLRIYRLAGKNFQLVRELRSGPTGTYLFVDAADINGDGRPEVFVTNMNNKTLQSFVLETVGNQLKYTHKDLPYYFRVQTRPGGKGMMLLGQKAAVDIPFFGPVYEMEFKGGTYQPARELKLPELATVLNMCLVDLNGSGEPMTVVVDYGNYLRVYNRRGSRQWTSGGKYLASAKYVPYTPVTGTSEELTHEWLLPTRMVPTDLDQDGRQELVVVQNDDRLGGLTPGLQLFYQGTIFGLYWNGMSLAENWRTPRISGYLTDYAIADVGNVGRPALVLSVGQRVAGGFFERGVSHVVAFTLKPTSTKAPVTKNRGL